MKSKLLFALLIVNITNAQTQIGQDIGGDTGDTTFGSATALSANGNVLAIASEGYSPTGTPDGLVRIFDKSSGNWSEIGQDIIGPTNSRLGYNVKLSNNGSVLAVSNYGSVVKVFKNVNNNWVQIGQDIPELGHSISLSGDGSTIAIGDGVISVVPRPVTIYKNITGNWTQIGQIGSSSPYFGFSVSLSENGDTVVLSDYNPSGNIPGNATILVYKNINNNWVQVGNTITCKPIDGNIGYRIGISSDGNTIAFSANNYHTATQSYGSVEIYKNIANTWTQIGNSLTGNIPNESYGQNVLISGSGNVVAVGSMTSTGTLASRIEIYEFLQNNWIKKGEFKDPNGKLIWWTMSLSRDGKNLAFRNSGGVSFLPKLPKTTIEVKGSSLSVQVYNIQNLLSSDTFVLENFNIYPNPTTDILTIELKENLTLEKVIIYNTSGQLVKETTDKTINVSTLAKGIYSLQVITNKGKATKSVIVK